MNCAMKMMNLWHTQGTTNCVKSTKMKIHFTVHELISEKNDLGLSCQSCTFQRQSIFLDDDFASHLGCHWSHQLVQFSDCESINQTMSAILFFTNWQSPLTVKSFLFFKNCQKPLTV